MASQSPTLVITNYRLIPKRGFLGKDDSYLLYEMNINRQDQPTITKEVRYREFVSFREQLGSLNKSLPRLPTTYSSHVTDSDQASSRVELLNKFLNLLVQIPGVTDSRAFQDFCPSIPSSTSVLDTAAASTFLRETKWKKSIPPPKNSTIRTKFLSISKSTNIHQASDESIILIDLTLQPVIAQPSSSSSVFSPSLLPGIDDRQFYCSICDKKCTAAFNFSQHLKGKTHIRNSSPPFISSCKRSETSNENTYLSAVPSRYSPLLAPSSHALTYAIKLQFHFPRSASRLRREFVKNDRLCLEELESCLLYTSPSPRDRG